MWWQSAWTKRQAERSLRTLQSRLSDLGLEAKAAKTCIIELREGGEGLDFLGFHLRLVRANPPRQHIVFLARWPSRKAMQHARDRIRFLTARARLTAPPEQVVAEINRFLRSWAGYFRYGNSAKHFAEIRAFTVRRLGHFVGYRYLWDLHTSQQLLFQSSRRPPFSAPTSVGIAS